MDIYNVVGVLLSQYIDELSTVADEQRMTTFELISLELSVTRERLAEESARRILVECL